MQLIEVYLPTTEGRELLLRRRTEPIAAQLQLELSARRRRRISVRREKM